MKIPAGFIASILTLVAFGLDMSGHSIAANFVRDPHIVADINGIIIAVGVVSAGVLPGIKALEIAFADAKGIYKRYQKELGK